MDSPLRLNSRTLLHQLNRALIWRGLIKFDFWSGRLSRDDGRLEGRASMGVNYIDSDMLKYVGIIPD